MNERRPIAIRYASEGGGATFGWSVRGVDEVNPHEIPVFDPGAETVFETRGEHLRDKVHTEVLDFFNGPLTADLVIPQGYPYEFYEPENDKPVYTGRLREPKEKESK